MNYRDKIRKSIECPEFGNSSYGAWGSLRIDQRRKTSEDVSCKIEKE